MHVKMTGKCFGITLNDVVADLQPTNQVSATGCRVSTGRVSFNAVWMLAAMIVKLVNDYRPGKCLSFQCEGVNDPEAG